MIAKCKLDFVILLCKIKKVSRECEDMLQTRKAFHKKYKMKSIFKLLIRVIKQQREKEQPIQAVNGILSPDLYDTTSEVEASLKTVIPSPAQSEPCLGSIFLLPPAHFISSPPFR